MTVEGAATGQNGLPIVKMILYSNSEKVYEQENTDKIVVFEPYNDDLNGTYDFVLNAWDSDGHLFQSATTVTQIDAYYPCSQPASGINFCSPPNGTYQPNSFIQLAAYASSDVTSINSWLNGKLFTMSSGNEAAANYGSSSATNQWQTLTVKAYKGSQPVYTATTKYKAYYGCPGMVTACSIYINIQQPANYADVTSPFAVQATTIQNPNPITAMKVYIDNTVVATSTGATIVANVTASAGTHL